MLYAACRMLHAACCMLHAPHTFTAPAHHTGEPHQPHIIANDFEPCHTPPVPTPSSFLPPPQENIRRVGEVAKLFADTGIITLVSFISPYARDRDLVRERATPGTFVEVYMKTPLQVGAGVAVYVSVRRLLLCCCRGLTYPELCAAAAWLRRCGAAVYVLCRAAVYPIWSRCLIWCRAAVQLCGITTWS